VTVTWTSTFYPYGVEVFAEPIERHLVLGEDAPERIGPDGESRWTGILDTPVLRATTSWERIELGLASLASGEVVEPARVVEIPTALRLDSAPVLSGSRPRSRNIRQWSVCSFRATRS
jgi:hypothetical protein